jgi:hypothetical protein
LDQDTIEEFDQYVNDPDKFQILDNNSVFDDENESKSIRALPIKEFTDKYIDIIPISQSISQRRQN